MAILSILGIYNADDKIFNDMQLPVGVDRETLVINLLSECAELEFIYPSPVSARTFIGQWSNMQIKVWNRLAELFDLDYNPIWNVDGKETETETRDLKATGKVNSNAVSTETVAGFNNANFANNNQTKNNGSQDSTGTDTGTITRVKTRGGNIGVTTTQKMLSEELETRPKLNIYRYIIEDFKHRFCLLIY